MADTGKGAGVGEGAGTDADAGAEACADAGTGSDVRAGTVAGADTGPGAGAGAGGSTSMGSSEPDEDMASTETEQCREGRGIYMRLGTPSRMWVRLLNTESGRTTNLCPVVHA